MWTNEYTRLADMAIFARVVEANSFSQAAQALGLSKSAVSKQIARLEEALGLRLINRTTRRLSLTDAGQTFYEYCARMIMEAEEAGRAVASLQSEPKGLLRISAPMSFGMAHLAPLIPEFLKQNPDVTIDMELSDRFVDLVEDGFDLAIRIGALQTSSLVARRIASAQQIVCASPNYLKNYGTPQHPRDLVRHNCLRYTYFASQDEWPFRGPEGKFKVKVAGQFRANNGDALVAAALGGLGLVFMPSFLVGRELRQGRLIPVLKDWCEEAVNIHAVYPHRRHLTAKVRAFIDFCVQKFEVDPDWDRGLAVKF